MLRNSVLFFPLCASSVQVSVKTEEKVDLSGGPDLHFGKCKFRIKVPDKFNAGERKILKVIFGKSPNKEDFILKVHMTILEKQKTKTKQRTLPSKPSQKAIEDKLRDDIKTNPDGNVDDQNIYVRSKRAVERLY